VEWTAFGAHIIKFAGAMFRLRPAGRMAARSFKFH
jgi:hypothetical protein